MYFCNLGIDFILFYFFFVMLFCFFFFFFSSRRRHTRFDCDWSSDVCSSDLPASDRHAAARVRAHAAAGGGEAHAGDGQAAGGGDCPRGRLRGCRLLQPAVRSEERRVGKECRSRWSADQEKKKKKMENE